MDHGHAYATLACVPSHGWDRAGLSRPFQILSGADRRAFPDGGPLCGAQCVTGEAGESGRGLAVVEWVATDTRGSEADDLAQCLAGRAVTRLGGAGESPADRIGAGGAPSECAARQTLWGRRVGTAHGEALRDGSHVAASWATERIMKKDSRPLFPLSHGQRTRGRTVVGEQGSVEDSRFLGTGES